MAPRSDWVREIGIDQNAMREEEGVVFAVRRVDGILTTDRAIDLRH